MTKGQRNWTISKADNNWRSKVLCLWQNQHVRNMLFDIRFSVTYVVSRFRLLEQGSPKSVKEADKKLVDAFQLRSSLWRFCYKIWLRARTKLINVSTFQNATSNLWSWQMMSNLYSKQYSRARGSVIYSVLYIDSAHNRANEIDVLPCLSFECWTNCKKGSMSV